MCFFLFKYIIHVGKSTEGRNTSKMDFIEKIKNRARQEIKTIVLPEAEDIRVLKATEMAIKEKYANIILVGNKEKILNS